MTQDETAELVALRLALRDIAKTVGNFLTQSVTEDILDGSVSVDAMAETRKAMGSPPGRMAKTSIEARTSPVADVEYYRMPRGPGGPKSLENWLGEV
jgi:hypothetical protein